jgi:hypothetical protein
LMRLPFTLASCILLATSFATSAKNPFTWR